MEFHEYANIFPMMGEDEFKGLVSDIEANGLREPIYTHEGKIIDGRNRFKACLAIGMEPIFEEWNGTGSLVQFVLSLNLHRRHLNSSQKAVVALEILPMLEKEAKERQLSTLKQNTTVSQRIDTREERQGRATTQAAQMTNTNRQYVADAKRIHDEAPEMLEEIKSGEKTIPEIKRELFDKPHVARNTGENEWYTPAMIIEASRKVMGSIDLDPASSEIANKIVKSGRYYTAEDDGLTKEWSGKVWMNPPYASDLIGKFVDKLCQSFDSGAVTEAMVLINNATETNWFQNLGIRCSAIHFPSQRIKFLDPDGNPGAPLQGQALLYLGKHTDVFIAEFKQRGLYFT